VKKTCIKTASNTEYFLFSPESLEFEGFRLRENEYEAILISRGWRWSKTLSLYSGVEAGQRYLPQRVRKCRHRKKQLSRSSDALNKSMTRQQELQLEQERQEKQRLQVKAEQLTELLLSA